MDGLALDGVNCGVIDKIGNLWLGTNGGGVSRYDGKKFTNYTIGQGLANDSVMSITEDKTGSLWFGTAGGRINRYNGKSFINYIILLPASQKIKAKIFGLEHRKEE